MPGETDKLDDHRRNSVRYSSSTRRSGGRRSGAAANRSLPATANVKPINAGLIVGLVLVLACVIALVGFILSSGKADSGGRTSEAMQAIETTEKVAKGVEAMGITGTAYSQDGTMRSLKDIDASAMLAIPGSQAIEAITIDNGAVTTSACPFDTSSIKSAISTIEEQADCGFVFVDMTTGRGVAYNADEPIYIASAAKVVLTHFALQNGAAGDEGERFNIEEAILYSDNDAYEGFGYNYSSDGYGEWLSSHDVWFDDYVFDLYPPMSARSLASFWVDILHYIGDGSEDAQWFAGLLSSTETSFIRDATSQTGAFVMNKGGWIAEEGYASVTDAGIIQLDGRTYLMVIVTGQFDEGITEENVTALASALFDSRDQL